MSELSVAAGSDAGKPDREQIMTGSDPVTVPDDDVPSFHSTVQALAAGSLFVPCCCLSLGIPGQGPRRCICHDGAAFALVYDWRMGPL